MAPLAPTIRSLFTLRRFYTKKVSSDLTQGIQKGLSILTGQVGAWESRLCKGYSEN